MIVDNCPAHPEFSGLKAISPENSVFETKYPFLYTADGSGGSQMCLLYYFLILLTKLIES